MKSKAIQFAIEAHKGQKDDAGKDYFIEHVLRVGQIIEMVTDDEEVIAAAYLHDTIEDTTTTYIELVDTFSKRVADLVMEVTYEGKKDNYGRYFPRLKSKDGILIKFADRIQNLSRMEPWGTKRRKHYLGKSKFWKDGTDRKEKK